MALAIHAQVLSGGELFLSRVVQSGPLSVGPSPRDTVPTTALPRSIDLLTPTKEGFGLRLLPPLDGDVVVGGLRIRVQGGLLVDPRPEPLCLANGDSGQLRLDDGLELRFSVQRVRNAFGYRPWRMDRGLAAALVGTTCLALGLLCWMAPWEWKPATDPARVLEPRLTHRPAVLDLVRLKPGPKQVRTRDDGSRRPRSSSPPKVGRRRRAAPGPARDLLAVIKTNRRLSRVITGRKLTRSVDLALASLERSFTSTTIGGRLERGSRGGRDGVLDLLGSADLALNAAPKRSRPGSDPPSLAALPEVKRRPGLAPSSQPEISREAIRKVVAKGSAAVRLCYERELLTSTKPLEGRLLLRWRIDEAGRARDLTVVKDTLGSQALTTCVLHRIRTWRFPACRTSCLVVYPFDFFPRMS